MQNSQPSSAPFEFAQDLWGKMGFSLPGMVTPTFDVNELEKRLVDLKAVEGWLKMNLSMLQATIQTLEMQCSTLNAVRAMGNITAEQPLPAAAKTAAATSAAEKTPDPLQSTMWPWALMQQIQAQMQQTIEKSAPPPAATSKPGKKPS